MFRNPTVVTYLKLIAELCQKHRLPAIFDAREYVVAGGLMSYGPSIPTIYRQLATYVNKLLHGTTARELPIEQPRKFELVINLKTVKGARPDDPAVNPRSRRPSDRVTIYRATVCPVGFTKYKQASGVSGRPTIAVAPINLSAENTNVGAQHPTAECGEVSLHCRIVSGHMLRLASNSQDTSNRAVPLGGITN